MSRPAGCLPFPSLRKLRVAKARLRADAPVVNEIRALAPVLWRYDRRGAITALDVMRNLLGEPPTGGHERDTREPHATAANGKIPRPRVQTRVRHVQVDVADFALDLPFVPAIVRRGVPLPAQLRIDAQDPRATAKRAG